MIKLKRNKEEEEEEEEEETRKKEENLNMENFCFKKNQFVYPRRTQFNRVRAFQIESQFGSVGF